MLFAGAEQEERETVDNVDSNFDLFTIFIVIINVQFSNCQIYNDI